jgi:hypothetical protein
VCGKYDMGNDSFLQNGNQKWQPEAAKSSDAKIFAKELTE